jgi:3-hydroxymyristoyl/3-hydroxydecanoyl-(acyl carrier protein) dehydratase
MASHPCFAGHFPGNPIVPGVVILEYVQKQLLNVIDGYRISTLAQAKFIRSISPEEDFSITLTQTTKGTIKFLCANNAGNVMTGYFVIEYINNNKS